MSATRRRWTIHGGFLLVLLGVYFWVTRDGWLGHRPRGAADLSGVAVAFGMVAYIFYALVTTMLMLGAARVRGGPFIVHGLGMALWVGSILYKRADRTAREEESQRRQAEELRIFEEPPSK